MPANFVIVGHGQLQQAGVGWMGWFVLQYHTIVKEKRDDSKDAVEFPYGASLGLGSKPSQREEAEASSNVSDKSELDGTKSSSDGDPGVLYWA